MKYLVKLFAFLVWISGIVIANGFWSTFFAIFFPFWAWYLSAEKALMYFGVIQ